MQVKINEIRQIQRKHIKSCFKCQQFIYEFLKNKTYPYCGR
jgi:PP-loop superfamily ATP-utilizing enzyme